MKHAIVWMDQKEARIFEVDVGAAERSIVDAAGPHIHRHPKDQDTRTRKHLDDEHRFFQEVARALNGQEQILLVGPSQTKLRFYRYLHKREQTLESRIVGIESADHPTDGQLVAHLRSYFHESSPRPDAEG